MILVAGVVLAVMFVSLAVLVNAAIYTDNVATRGGDSAGEALAYQAGVVDSVGGLIDAENAAGGGFDDIRANVSDGTARIDEIHRENHLRRSAWTNATIGSGSHERGLLVRETDAAEFTTWTANASAVRRFVIDLDTDAMTEGAALGIDLNGTDVEVRVNDTDHVVVTGGEEGVECAVDAGGTVRFDVTGERLGAQPCRFGWPDLDDDSRIGLEDGANGAGTYEVTLDSDDAPGGLPGGIATEALYELDLVLRIDTPTLSYETTARVAPGEPDV
jgi:hypothetical protein